jgi:hypothetical protein
MILSVAMGNIMIIPDSQLQTDHCHIEEPNDHTELVEHTTRLLHRKFSLSEMVCQQLYPQVSTLPPPSAQISE